MNNIKYLEKEIISYLKVDKIYFFWKGRVALYALLKAMGVGKGDEVILPAFTCIVVPNVIIYLEAKPIYVDIFEGTYNINTEQVENKITEKTKVIICQNTFGYSSGLNKLNKIAKKHKLYTIEDCAHGFGGTFNGAPNGTNCDAAFFSTQWNKPFSTGIGGFAITKHDVIADKMELLNDKLLEPTFFDLANLKVLYFIKRYFVNDYSYWVLISIYRYLSDKGIILGSSNDDELTSVNFPKRFFRNFSNVQAKEGIRNIKQLDKVLLERRYSSEKYSSLLKSNGKIYVKDEHNLNHSFLKYPILVKDKIIFMKNAEKSNISLGDWFLSPLHPYQGDFSNWYFQPEKYPAAKYISEHIVNLPTNPSNLDKVLTFIKNNLSLIK